MFVVHALAAVAPAAAGGSHMSPVRDRYEPGDVATLVGYTSGGQLGWIQDGPFYAYLVAGDVTLWSDRRLPLDHVGLGPLTVQARGRALRVSITFPVPDHFAPGLYTVTYCNDPCTSGLGDLIGGSVAVSVDPPRTIQREWPVDEPEIANLAADAILTGPGDRVTAADVRAGRAVEPPARKPGVGQPIAPERPTPPQVDRPAEVPAVVTTVLPEAAAQRTSPSRPGEGRDDRSWASLLMLTMAVVALVGAAGIQRSRARRLETRHASTGAPAPAGVDAGRRDSVPPQRCGSAAGER
jgi:hypothetical protein